MRAYIFLILVFLSATASAQIKISKAKGVDISVNKTFAIEKGQAVSFKEKKINEANFYTSFKEAITRVMTLRGYQRVEDSTAHLVVSYFYEESVSTEFQKTGPSSQVVVDESYKLERSDEKRTLIIDIEKNKSSLWTANCMLDGRQNDLDKIINATIERAFKKFPIQKDKK